MISRKQQSELLSTHLGPAAALVSSVVILPVFAQPGWHMFHDLRHFCFNLLNTLRCGHSHWLDLLIQLACLDASLLLPPSLSQPYPLPPMAFLPLALTLASNLLRKQKLNQHHSLHSAQISDEQVTRMGRFLECSKKTDVMQNKQNKDHTNML